jgi:hypothetical protein
MNRYLKVSLTCLFLLAGLHAGSASAVTVAGVDLDDSIAVGGSEVRYNGAGLRKKLFIKLYVGSLYLANPSSDAQSIIDADEAMAVRLNILSDLLTRDKMVEAMEEGFNNATDGDTSAIQPQIDQMLSVMQDKIRPGDSYTLAYEPGVGTHVIRNGETLTTIEGLPFKQALFGIWLSARPAQQSLKTEMLGG